MNPNSKVNECALLFFEEGLKSSGIENVADNNEEIKEIIRKAVSDIKNLNFEPIKDKDNCKFCNYKLICRLNNQN